MPRQLRPTPRFQGALFAAGRQGMGLRSQHVMNALGRSQRASDERKRRELERERMAAQEKARKDAESQARKDRNLQMGLMAGTAVVGGALAAGALAAPAAAATATAGEVAATTTAAAAGEIAATTAPAVTEAATVAAGEIATGTAGQSLGASTLAMEKAAESGGLGLGLTSQAAPTTGSLSPGFMAASSGKMATPTLGLNAGPVASPIASASRFAPAAVVPSPGPSVGRGVLGVLGGLTAGGATRGFGGGGGGPGPARTPARSITGRDGGQARPISGPPAQQPGGPIPQTGQQFGISRRQQPFSGQGGQPAGPTPGRTAGMPGMFPQARAPAVGLAGAIPGTVPYPSTLKRSLVGAGLGLTDAFSGANNLGGYLGQLGGIPGRNAALAQQMWQRGRADRQDTALADYRGGLTADRNRGYDLDLRRENRLENPRVTPQDELATLRLGRERGDIPLSEVGAADLARKQGLESRAAEAADYAAKTRPSVDDVRGGRALARETAGFTRDIRRNQAFDGIGPRLTGPAAQIAQSGRAAGLTKDEIATKQREYFASIGQPGGRGAGKQTLSDFRDEVINAGFSAENADLATAMKIGLEPRAAASVGAREAARAEMKLAKEIMAAFDDGKLPLSEEDQALFSAIISRTVKTLSSAGSRGAGGGKDVTGSLRAIRTRIEEALRLGNPLAARFILDEAAGTLSKEDREMLEFVVSQAGG